jgi:hypothetical protein
VFVSKALVNDAEYNSLSSLDPRSCLLNLIKIRIVRTVSYFRVEQLSRTLLLDERLITEPGYLQPHIERR